MHEQIVAYETDLRNKTEELSKKRLELEGKTEPDGSGFEARENAIRDEENGFIRTDAELQTNIGRLTDKHRLLAGIWTHYKENIRQAESDFAFARKLRGDTAFEELAPLVGAISPVPGGVGAITTTLLLRHVIEAAENLS